MKPSSVSLYEPRKKIIPEVARGRFARVKRITLLVSMVIFFMMPWFNSSSGRQMILFDFYHRRFYFFDWVFWPEDLVLLAFMLVIAALSLFVITSLVGRIYCGYVCPQTVWTRCYLWIERLIEGSSRQQHRLDKVTSKEGILFIKKVIKKITKHSLWFLIAFFTALTFVGYFVPIKELSQSLYQFTIGNNALFALGFFTTATYLNAGWMREQVCLYICPYARFQSLMYDEHTLHVIYDKNRKDCIDCKKCVQVCPMGIDIRQGLQLECINCAACLDVCDDVMKKISAPKGLISYSSEKKLSGEKIDFIRGRVIGYASSLALMFALFLLFFYMRADITLDIIQDRNHLYQVNKDGSIDNLYQLKIFNKSSKESVFHLGLEQSSHYVWMGESNIRLNEGESKIVPVRIRLFSKELISQPDTLSFVIKEDKTQEVLVREKGLFFMKTAREG
jgi:cytochrome c oxidase accessory protein FixG